jgi:hypothetical protein
LLIVVCGSVQAYELRGHFKPRVTAVEIPSDSALREFTDDPAVDAGFDMRLNFSDGADGWSWQADYQLLAIQGDQTELVQQESIPGFDGDVVVDDDRRVMDLSSRISAQEDRVVAHRLDRLDLRHTTDKMVFIVGRQAVSWGNGVIYNPVDFFNPFDPAAIDTEYKTGDDMIYAQYLADSGDDLQAVWVGRRDDAGDVTSDVDSLALKHHVFSMSSELDLLVADHYDAHIGAIGGSIDIADAIWRGDLMLTEENGEQFTSAVLSWSYALLAWERNLSVSVEYFRNGFGIDDGNYDPLALADRPELVVRIERGELFTLAQNYLAAAATIELTPLWLLTTSVFGNLDDDSMLLQIFSRHDLQQDLQLLLALNLPRGDDGSEFGGIDTGVSDDPLSVGASLFAQLAWYF